LKFKPKAVFFFAALTFCLLFGQAKSRGYQFPSAYEEIEDSAKLNHPAALGIDAGRNSSRRLFFSFQPSPEASVIKVIVTKVFRILP
jgi:hypothetical protein